jgi:hypothetical protein
MVNSGSHLEKSPAIQVEPVRDDGRRIPAISTPTSAKKKNDMARYR